MNSQKLILLILLSLSACTSYQSTTRRSVDYVTISPISIFRIEATLIDKTYIITGHTQTIPPSYIKRFTGFVYEITLSVKVNGVNTWWDSPFEAVLILPNGEIAYYNLNEEEFSMSSSFIEDFKIRVETPKKGRVRCALSFADYPTEFSLTDYDWWFVDLN